MLIVSIYNIKRLFPRQALQQTGESAGVDIPGGYDWQHRFTPKTISRVMIRKAQSRQRPLDPDDRRHRSRPRRHYRKHHEGQDREQGRGQDREQGRGQDREQGRGQDREQGRGQDRREDGETPTKHRRRRERSDRREGSEERRSHRHHRRHRRRSDVGPNTHVIRGGELETHLIRRLGRWTNRDDVEEVSFL